MGDSRWCRAFDGALWLCRAFSGSCVVRHHNRPVSLQSAEPAVPCSFQSFITGCLSDIDETLPAEFGFHQTLAAIAEFQRKEFVLFVKCLEEDSVARPHLFLEQFRLGKPHKLAFVAVG